jgi:hypothetical protein
MGLTKTASLDGRKHDIAVGQIDVGNAATEMAMRMAKGVPQANGEIAVEPLMDVNMVGQSVLYMANLPLDGQRDVPYRHGHQDALCRAGLTRPEIRGGPPAHWP